MGENANKALTDATREFYAQNAASFSATRTAPWEGWERVAQLVAPALETARHASRALDASGSGREFRVLDLGCGNLRFERFLLERFPDLRFRFVVVDECAELVEPNLQELEAEERASAEYMNMDVLDKGARETLLSREDPFDLAAAFGIFHHIPTERQRAALLQAMVRALSPGGLAVASFWQFAKSPRLKAKAERATEQAAEALGVNLSDEGDYFLGWQDVPESFRYCHSFTAEEARRLCEEATANSPEASMKAQFESDSDREGRALNVYIALECAHEQKR